jgi:hypothetical protein
VIGRRDLAATLDQRAVRIEQQLRVVDGGAVALVDTERDDHPGFAGGFGDRVGLGGRYGHRLLEQTQVLLGHRVGRLHEGEVGTVGNDGLGEDVKSSVTSLARSSRKPAFS